MKNWKWVLLVGLCLTFVGFVSNSAIAQEIAPTASVYLVHGIPGHDVGATLDPALPVDVLLTPVTVNPTIRTHQITSPFCLASGIKFGDILGPYTIPPGSYAITVSPAVTDSPCTNTVVLGPYNTTLSAGENASIVIYLAPPTVTPDTRIHRWQTGNSVPMITKFDNDLGNVTSIANGKSRVIAHHVANVGTANSTISLDTFTLGEHPVLATLGTVTGLTNGTQVQADFPIPPGGGSWAHDQITITPAGGTLLGPYFFQMVAHTVFLMYGVGSPSTQTFTVLIKAIPGV